MTDNHPINSGSAMHTVMARFLSICPEPSGLYDPPGYRDSGFALVDAVWSIQLQYDRVIKIVHQVAARAGHDVVLGNHDSPDAFTIADLYELIRDLNEEELVAFFGAAYTASGRPKALVVREVARSLVAAGITCREDVRGPGDPGYAAQRTAWCDVHGLGDQTHNYMRVLCGQEAFKVDVMLTRWLTETVGPMTIAASEQTLGDLTEALATHWGTPVSRRAVDHTIWRFQRDQ